MSATTLVLLLAAVLATAASGIALHAVHRLRRQLITVRQQLTALTGTAPDHDVRRARSEEIHAAVAEALAEERERELAEARAFWAEQEARDAADPLLLAGRGTEYEISTLETALLEALLGESHASGHTVFVPRQPEAEDLDDTTPPAAEDDTASVVRDPSDAPEGEDTATAPHHPAAEIPPPHGRDDQRGRTERHDTTDGHVPDQRTPWDLPALSPTSRFPQLPNGPDPLTDERRAGREDPHEVADTDRWDAAELAAARRRHPSQRGTAPPPGVGPFLSQDDERTVERLAELAATRTALTDVRPGPLGTLDVYVFADGTTVCMSPGHGETTRRLADALAGGTAPQLLGGSSVSGAFALTFACGEEHVFVLADRVVAHR